MVQYMVRPVKDLTSFPTNGFLVNLLTRKFNNSVVPEEEIVLHGYSDFAKLGPKCKKYKLKFLGDLIRSRIKSAYFNRPMMREFEPDWFNLEWRNNTHNQWSCIYSHWLEPAEEISESDLWE